MPQLNSTYTMYIKREGEIDEVVVRSAGLVSAMRYAVEHDGSRVSSLSVEEYSNFRRFQWLAKKRFSGASHAVLLLSATVPKSRNAAADERVAIQILGEQFLRDPNPIWHGCIDTDDDYENRVQRMAEETAARNLEKSICTDVIYDLISVGYQFTGNLIQSDREFWCSEDCTAILDHVLRYKEAEFTLHGHGSTHWIRFFLGWGPDKIIESHASAISWIVEPVVAKYLREQRRFPFAIDNEDDEDDVDDCFIADDDE